MFESTLIRPPMHRYPVEIRKEDLTIDNIRTFFRHVSLKILGDEERSPELVAGCSYGRGIKLDWLGEQMPWDVFLTRVAITLGIIRIIKEDTYHTKGLALDELFKIAKIERKRRKKEMFVHVKENELVEANVQVVLGDAAQKFLGDPNLVARISTMNCPLVRKGVKSRVRFCGRTMEWGDFICSCAISLGLAGEKTEASKHYKEVLDILFGIAKITRSKSLLGKFLDK